MEPEKEKEKPEIDAENVEFENEEYKEEKLAMKLKKLMSEKFGINTFRPNQETAVLNVMKGKHVLVIMATGGEKSLIYQLPALMQNGVTVVISPLKSLMLEQVMDLQEKNICAEQLMGRSCPRHEVIYSKLLNMDIIKLLYVTPEKIVKNSRFSNILKILYERNMLNQFVVDENLSNLSNIKYVSQ